MTSGFYLLIDTGLVLTDDYRIEVPDLYLAENEIMISSGDSGLRDCKGWKATRTYSSTTSMPLCEVKHNLFLQVELTNRHLVTNLVVSQELP